MRRRLEDAEFQGTEVHRDNQLYDDKEEENFRPCIGLYPRIFDRRGKKNMGTSIKIANRINDLTSHEKTLSWGSRGGLFMISGSGGDRPRASAGSPSVAKFMYNMAAGRSGRYSGPEMRTTPPMTMTSVMLH